VVSIGLGHGLNEQPAHALLRFIGFSPRFRSWPGSKRFGAQRNGRAHAVHSVPIMPARTRSMGR